MNPPVRPPDPDDTPDRWREADKAWEEKWTDDAEADRAEVDEAPRPPSDAYRPVRPTAGSVSDAYGDGMREAGPYLGLGLQIGGSMALFVGLGYVADRMLGTTPWGVLVGALLGMVGIVALVVRLANEANAAAKAKNAKRPGTTEQG